MKLFTMSAAAPMWLATTAYGAEQAAAIPPSTSAGSLIQVLFGLTVVLGLMAAAAWALKRFGAKRSIGGAAVKVIGGVSVGGRERILLIEAADQWIVVGVAPGCINALATMPKQESVAVAETAQAGNNFASWLKQTIEKRNGH